MEEAQNFVSFIIFMCFLRKRSSLQRASNFDVSQCVNSKFNDMGYVDQFFKHVIYFQFKVCMTS